MSKYPTSEDDEYNRQYYTSKFHGDLTPDVDPGHRVQADASSVVSSRARQISKNTVELTNSPAGVFDVKSSPVPSGPKRLMRAKNTLEDIPDTGDPRDNSGKRRRK